MMAAPSLREYLVQIIDSGNLAIQVDLSVCLELAGGSRLQILTGGLRRDLRVFHTAGIWELFDFPEG
jgi:hypothetical protein